MLLADAPVETRDPSTIIVDRQSRQRKSLDKDVGTLAEQLANAGQINPILIHSDGRLVAGERRLRAALSLGWSGIRCTVVENLPPHKAFLIELLENIARRELSWQDTASAILAYHEMRVKAVPEWTVQATGADIGLSRQSVSLYLRVAARLDDPDVAGCQTLQGAFNLLRGRADRAVAAAQSRGLEIGAVVQKLLRPMTGSKEEKTAAMAELILDDEAPTEHDPFAILDAAVIAELQLRASAAEESGADTDSPIITADFLSWVASYSGPRFDVLHIDFPYGKGYTGSNTRKTGRAHIAPRYKDDPDVFWTLLETLLEHQDRIAQPCSHCMFWFDMEYYSAIRESFETAGWTTVAPFPLIWAKSYQGVASDPGRRPRHCYETALLFSRGDRRLVRLDQDFWEGRKDENLHLNQKSLPMLKHFLRMLVDEHTAVLDPTCGSGTALAAARQIGASRILGLELDPSNAEVARFVLDRPELDEEPGQ